jgi:hypothetical protein
MKTLTLSLAALVLGASLSQASAEGNGRTVAAVATAPITVGAIVEGRQAAPITATGLTGAERLVIERNLATTR